MGTLKGPEKWDHEADVIAIGGGAAYMGSSSDLFSSEPEIEENVYRREEYNLLMALQKKSKP